MKNRKVSVPLLIVSILLLAIIGGFIYYYFQASATIASKNIEISNNKSQISELQNQLSSTNTDIASLRSQVTSLQSQITDLQSIINLSKSSTKANLVPVNQTAGQSSLVVTFKADYAGYITISGNSNTTNGIIKVTDSFHGYKDYSYPFVTNKDMIIPVLPGTINVYFSNTNFLGGVSAAITVIYYY